jgi:MATE family multidrug resistance protein
MKHSKIDKEIFRLAWPNIISNVSVPLLSSVDTALMGGLSTAHLGAVGLGAMVFNFFYWNFSFLRMGTTGMTAQAYGAQSEGDMARVFYRAMLVAFGIAFLLITFQRPITNFGIMVMGGEEELVPLMYTYITTRIWAAPATLGLYVLFGWLFGMQNARAPMLVTIAVNVVNIVVSYTLIIHMDQGIYGAALGTVAAQYFGFLLTLIILVRLYRGQLTLPNWSEVLDRVALLKFFSVNRDIFIRTVCLTFAFAFFYSRSTAYGEVVLGVHVILLQFLNWMSYGVDGFAYAAESVVGKWFGAGDEDTTTLAIKRSFYWGLWSAVFFSVLYGLGGGALFRLFTDQKEVLDAAYPSLWWMVILPLLGYASYIWDGVFVGMTASKGMRDSMIFSLAVYLLVYFSLEGTLGSHALWLALCLFLVARALAQAWLYRRKGMQLA